VTCPPIDTSGRRSVACVLRVAFAFALGHVFACFLLVVIRETETHNTSLFSLSLSLTHTEEQ